MERALIALSILALAPLAQASDDTFSYEFTDPSFDAMPPPADAWADITAGKMEVVDASTLRATLTLSVLPEMRAGVAYGFIFGDGSHEWYGAAVMAPELHYFVGDWVDGGPGSASDSGGSYVTGPEGTVTIEIPRSLVGNATRLLAPKAMTADATTLAAPVSVGAGIVFLDEGQGTGDLQLPPREPSVAAENATGEPRGETPGATRDQVAPPASTPATRSAVPLPWAAAIGALVGAALSMRRKSR
ncbi:MAG TPA: hypothetical protein VM370_12310 [Candidatus Thermoplasmatota archaeon]|nr:hypothetical protein [Candidatus Thermoplasmatota archaeon]